MARKDKGTAVSTNAEVDSPNAKPTKKAGTSGGFTWTFTLMRGLLNLVQLVGTVALTGILIGTLAGIPGATDIKNTKDTTTALAANNFRSAHVTVEFYASGSTATPESTFTLNNYYSLAYEGLVAEFYAATYYYSYAYGECDTYMDTATADDARRLAESTHHQSQLTPALAIEAKLAKLTGKTKRHLDEKVDSECGDRDDECLSAGQGASALFVISFILSFANAVVAFLTINGSDDTKTKISAALHVLVILLTSIAVGLFTLDCTNLLSKDFKEGYEEAFDALIDADDGVDVSYTWVYTNGATFSCGMTAIVLSFVLAVLRFIPQPQPVAEKPDVKEGENLVGEA